MLFLMPTHKTILLSICFENTCLKIYRAKHLNIIIDLIIDKGFISVIHKPHGSINFILI